MKLRINSAWLAASLSVTLLVAVVSSGQADQSKVLPHPSTPKLFETSASCISCHNNLSAPTGEDISIGTNWRATMMANSARDPYWQASVRRETLDHPGDAKEIEGECSTCHMPMAHFQARAEGRPATVFNLLPVGQTDDDDSRFAADGVSCTVCHQVRDTLFGKPESFNGNFAVDVLRGWKKRNVYGPFEIDSGRANIMHSSSEFRPTLGAHIQKSELCATCHTLFTNARDANGKVVGRLPEQVPYLEWQNSDRTSQSCQSCHMPVVKDSAQVSGVWGQKRDSVSRHDFRGGNFFMQSMLNRYRAELGVEATSQELNSAAQRTAQHLGTETARLSITNVANDAGHLRATIAVQNITGHKFPTAYPSRRAWIHLVVRNSAGSVVFESGAVRPDGSIVGNDNDIDASKFEPHYREITSPDQVQIYESVMADAEGRVTTGLLSALRYVKDNRLLPTGFDKAKASPDVAVHGDASADPDFTAGGDQVSYAINLAGAQGPLTIIAELRFQPIGFRWARNLASRPSFETARFVSYYDSMASTSSTLVASQEKTIP